MHFTCDNINTAFDTLQHHLRVSGVEADSRNGRVITLTQPLLLTLRDPCRRVLFCEERKSNPFLYFFDTIFSLSTVNKVDFIAQFGERMREYSDDGETFHGHYGSRLRPQLFGLIDLLQRDPGSRQAVLSIWHHTDLTAITKDKPCNVMLMFRVNGYKLDLTVINRSNDFFWGLFGANIPQFSTLLELVATELGLEVGQQHHFINNLHCYLDFGPKRLDFKIDRDLGSKTYFSFLEYGESIFDWLDDADALVASGRCHFKTWWFRTVATAAMDAWEGRMNPDLKYADDWRTVFTKYKERVR